MKLIIAGGRNYILNLGDLLKLQSLFEDEGVTAVVSGGCKGADECGERWALSNGIPVDVFDADWTRYGNYAGPLRNKKMARYADAVVLFPGGRGTESMHREAKTYGLKIYDWRKTNERISGQDCGGTLCEPSDK